MTRTQQSPRISHQPSATTQMSLTGLNCTQCQFVASGAWTFAHNKIRNFLECEIHTLAFFVRANRAAKWEVVLTSTSSSLLLFQWPPPPQWATALPTGDIALHCPPANQRHHLARMAARIHADKSVRFSFFSGGANGSCLRGTEVASKLSHWPITSKDI